MKSDLKETIKTIDTRSSTTSHNHSSEVCKGNHDHVENKIKSYMASEIKELNKNLATKITALLRIHMTELTRQIGEADKGMSETTIKDLIETTCSTSPFLDNMINNKIMAGINRTMLEFDDKISKSVASKVRNTDTN